MGANGVASASQAFVPIVSVGWFCPAEGGLCNAYELMNWSGKSSIYSWPHAGLWAPLYPRTCLLSADLKDLFSLSTVLINSKVDRMNRTQGFWAASAVLLRSCKSSRFLMRVHVWWWLVYEVSVPPFYFILCHFADCIDRPVWHPFRPFVSTVRVSLCSFCWAVWPRLFKGAGENDAWHVERVIGANLNSFFIQF